MSRKFLFNLLLFGMHYFPVHGTEVNWKGVDAYNNDLCEQILHKVHQKSNMENVKRSFKILHEQVDNSYNKRSNVFKQNRMAIQKENRKQNKPNQQRHFKRRTVTKFINEWILFIFILHCLFAGALLDHIGTHWNI